MKEENQDDDIPIAAVSHLQDSVHLITDTKEEAEEDTIDTSHPEEFYLIEPRGQGKPMYIIVEDQVLSTDGRSSSSEDVKHFSREKKAKGSEAADKALQTFITLYEKCIHLTEQRFFDSGVHKGPRHYIEPKQPVDGRKGQSSCLESVRDESKLQDNA